MFIVNNRQLLIEMEKKKKKCQWKKKLAQKNSGKNT
jgi:hypothetical protein